MPLPPYQAAKQQYPYRVTVKLRSAFSLGDTPSVPSEKYPWIGYYNFMDQTRLPDNCLTYPSQNCFIPFKDQVVPRLGNQLLGQPYTNDWPIIGHKERFTNLGGIETEVRVTQSSDANLKDIIEVLYPNPGTGVLQWYQITQNVNPLTAGIHRYYMDDWFDTNLNPGLSLNLPRLIWVNGLNQIFSWTGGIAPIVSVNTNTSISTTPGITWESLGFVAPLSSGFINYINGTGTFIVGDIITGLSSGATGKVTAVDSASLTLTDIVGIFSVNESITGSSSGATGTVGSYIAPSTQSSGNITVNGVLYTITGGWDTDTLTLSNTSGILANDVAFSQIQVDSAPIPFDVCSNNQNYMFYGSWKSRSLYMSNQFSNSATQEITAVQANQNDLVLGLTPFTGMGNHVYRVTIDSVNPNNNSQEYIPGTGSLNDGTFNTAGYNAGGITPNIYKVAMLGDLSLVASITSGIFSIGDTVTGATSMAQGVVITTYNNGTNQVYGIRMITGFGFVFGENVTGSSSTHVNVVVQSLWQNWIQYSKNNIVINIDTGSGSMPIAALNTNIITLSDGLTIQFANFQGHGIGDVFQLTINTAGYDTFQYQVDGGAPIETMQPITAGDTIFLQNDVTLSFVSQTGHTIGDYWEISVNQAITDAWSNFYYTLNGIPTSTTFTNTPSGGRRPGEGYIFQLSANFWAMAPQESEMYVNTQYGKWAYISVTLSSNLQEETVTLTPLKQAAISKVIFPYMIGYMDNDLIFVTENKKLDIIGRMVFIQLPQIDNLSQPVENDFNSASFENGSVNYWNKTLFITSPNDNKMFCYDEHPENKYWQPPQAIPENGILSTYGNSLISHSGIRNQTNTLFTATNGDNGTDYTVIARKPAYAFGSRWEVKDSNMSFVEGYVTGNPPMKFAAYLDLITTVSVSHILEPVISPVPTKAAFGEGSFGSHSFGSDIYQPNPHFYEIYEQFRPILSYRFAALEMSCTTTNHSYSWLDWDLNVITSALNNQDLKSKEIISQV